MTAFEVTQMHEGSAKYIQLKTNIKNWILSGKIKPNQKIPSENQLAESFGISRHTVRQAIGELVNEGLLYREHGKGTFVQLLDNCNKKTSSQRVKIAVITTYITDYIFPHIIKGIESVVTEKGHALSLLSTGNNQEKERKCLETVLLEGIDGLIVEPTKSTLPNPNIDLYLLLQQKNIPFVMLHSSYVELNASMVALDDAKGAYLVTKHLIDMGHEHIAGIFKKDDMQGRNRFRGFVKAHQDALLSVDARMISSYDTEERNSIVPKFLNQMFNETTLKPTAIVCYNDEIAIQVVNEIANLGFSVPEDISVTGFDDSTLALVSSVPLTTVRHPKAEMGQVAAKLLFELLEDKNSAWIPREHIFDPELVLRKSTMSLTLKDVLNS